MKNNIHELADIIKLAAQLGIDRVKGHQLWAHFEEIKELSLTESDESIDLWNNAVEQAYLAQRQFKKPNGEQLILENIIPIQKSNTSAVPQEYDCPFLNKEIWISATGKISPCCAPDKLRDSLGDFGNINTTTIEEVFNSKVYLDLVSNYKTLALCKTCNMRKPQA
jgi:MoaA/NifB/PqqE/SkfB family radical SAM enzyme